MKKLLFSKTFKDYAIYTFALFLSSCFYNLFLRSLNIVTGGVNGIAIILENVTKVDNYVLQFVLNFLFLLLSFTFMKKQGVIGVLYLTIVYPLFVYLTGILTTILVISKEEMLLYSFLAGIGVGVSNGLIYKSGFTTGGVGVLAFLLAKKMKASVSLINAILNAVIVFASVFVFGFEEMFYALIVIYVSKVVSDKLFLGISNNKVFYVMSSKYEDILNLLLDIGHDATIYDVKDKNKKIKSKMIMCVVPTKEYFVVKQFIEDMDPNAFVFISDNYEVSYQDVSINFNKD